MFKQRTQVIEGTKLLKIGINGEGMTSSFRLSYFYDRIVRCKPLDRYAMSVPTLRQAGSRKRYGRPTESKSLHLFQFFGHVPKILANRRHCFTIKEHKKRTSDRQNLCALFRNPCNREPLTCPAKYADGGTRYLYVAQNLKSFQ